MDENLPKYETSGKNGEINVPKISVLNTSNIIGRMFIMPPQEYGKKF